MSSDSASLQPQTGVQKAYKADDDGPQTCRWVGCDAQFDDAEALFVHINEDHVGRNSRGNLCLVCQWDGCTVSKTKRDHLISHIKSHIPYKPYSCERCAARFKHMSDLKRHDGTHRDKNDSPPSSNYNTSQSGFSIGLASPELQSHQINVELAQSSINSLAGANFAPIDMNAIHPGGINPASYASTLPPSPMPTPSMNPHDSGSTVPIDITGYAAAGLFNADGTALSVTAMEADPLVNTNLTGIPAYDQAVVLEALNSINGGPDAAPGYLPPDLARGVYTSFLSAVLTVQPQQANLTLEIYQLLVGLSRIDPATLDTLIKSTPTEHLALLQQFHSQLSSHLAALQPSPAPPDPSIGIEQRTKSGAGLFDPQDRRPRFGFVRALAAILGGSTASSGRHATPAIPKYQPKQKINNNVRSATLPKARQADKDTSRPKREGKDRPSSIAGLSGLIQSSPSGDATAPSFESEETREAIQSLLDRLKEKVDRQVSTTQKVVHSTEKDSESQSPVQPPDNKNNSDSDGDGDGDDGTGRHDSADEGGATVKVEKDDNTAATQKASSTKGHEPPENNASEHSSLDQTRVEKKEDTSSDTP